MYPENMTAVGTAAIQQQPHASHTQAQLEELDKTLNHLAGRVVELRERMSGVLLPAPPTGEGANQAQPEPQRCSLAERIRGLRLLAGSTIADVEDVLNRLDV
jgi:hypothetical protein